MYVFRRMDRYRSMDRGATTLGGEEREGKLFVSLLERRLN